MNGLPFLKMHGAGNDFVILDGRRAAIALTPSQAAHIADRRRGVGCDQLILIGESKGHLGASLYARQWLGLKGDELGPPPPVDLEVEKRNADFVGSLIEQGLVNAVHDVSDGGIACAVAEMALASGVGVALRQDDEMPLEILFGEQQGRFLVASTPNPQDQGRIFEEAKCQGDIRAVRIAEFTNHGIRLDATSDLPLSHLREAHEGWLPRYMAGIG